MLKFLAKWWRWLWCIDPAVEPSEYRADDCHDSIDPQAVTRIYGNAIEKGDWR